MSNAKEIRTKISSVENTQKITRAMEMVAASKMRKTQERMAKSKPYSVKIRQVIGHLASATAEYRHAYLTEHEAIKRVGYIIVSTDRSLCGGLNINLFKKVYHSVNEWKSKGVDVEYCLIGRKAVGLCKSLGGDIVASTEHLGDAPSISDLIGVVSVMLEHYCDGKIDALFIASNDYVNTMMQKPCVAQMLPLEKVSEDAEARHSWDYLYEPDAKELLDELVKRYIESQVYQAVVENIACEQAARMVAMKSASDNAGDIIDGLRLVYNKARQAAITQEISEIVGGAEAV